MSSHFSCFVAVLEWFSRMLQSTWIGNSGARVVLRLLWVGSIGVKVTDCWTAVARTVTDYWIVVAPRDTGLIHFWDLGVNPIGKICKLFGTGHLMRPIGHVLKSRCYHF